MRVHSVAHRQPLAALRSKSGLRDCRSSVHNQGPAGTMIRLDHKARRQRVKTNFVRIVGHQVESARQSPPTRCLTWSRTVSLSAYRTRAAGCRLSFLVTTFSLNERGQVKVRQIAQQIVHPKVSPRSPAMRPNVPTTRLAAPRIWPNDISQQHWKSARAGRAADTIARHWNVL